MSSLKWHLPHLRILPEDIQSDISSSSSLDGEQNAHHELKDDSVNVEAHESEPQSAQQSQLLKEGIPYELRDEKGRKWWKYFDEFEYRANSEYKTSRSWYSFLYPNHTTHSKAERRLLYKLDFMIGFYFLMLCWCKSLDTNNYSNAYFSGMQKDLKMTKNDYINTVAISNVGAIVLQLPFMYLLPRFPAHYILPIMDLGWSFFTLACYRAQSLPELRAYRFMVSAFGSAYYPVSQYVLGSWYAPDEISSRVCLFFCGQLLGGVTSGLLQASTYKTLNGIRGLAGWRWMFLIDAVAISIPCAIIGFFVIPGVPSKCYSLFLTDEEIRVARARNRRNQINDKVDKSKLLSLFSWKLWKKVFGTSTFWVLVVFDTCSWNNMTAFSGSFLFWLKNDHNYSVVQINNYSVLPACLGFVFVFICAWGADLFRCKWFFMVLSQVMNCVSCAILVKWDVSASAKWFAFLITYFSVAASPCLWSFINDFLRLDPQIKAVTWIAIYSFSQSTYAWIPTLAWKTVEQPRFKTGYTVSLVFSAIYGVWTFVVLYFYKRNEKRNALGNGIILYNSDNGEHAPTFVDTLMERKGEYFYVKETEKAEI
ncbi:LAQU0S01e03576g1_1 [Lachancea quebecensis]|uniref:LAQU0S01e03576g1_1 n=1 Tax=Lachancea quebecensis TaxID=1654605 RepID=A0A0P1KNW5_9SACH|nr:LAQU0S01e03576g1_1 [Lachancea quebecensis]